MIKSIGFIGSGNVASNLALAFQKHGIDIKFIFSKTIENQKILANKLNCKAPNSLQELVAVDAILICVTDDQIKPVARQLINYNSLIIHCSGSVSLSALKRNKNFGVLYPFQSFTRNEKVTWNKIPILVEANNAENEKWILAFSKMLSSHVEILNSEKRKKLHLSGVLTNNFMNHLAVLSNDFLLQNNINPNLLNALTEQTLQKIMKQNPESYQTGPASRKDKKTINSHLKLLDKHDNLKEIYLQFTKSIINWKNKKQP